MNPLLDAIATDGHAPFPAGSLLLLPGPEVGGEPMAPPTAAQRLAQALGWLAAGTEKSGSGGTLGSLVQRSTAAWLDHNGLMGMTLSDFVDRALELASPALGPMLTRFGTDQPVQVQEQALRSALKRKAKHWQARRCKPANPVENHWPRLLAADSVGGDAFLATAQQMQTALGQAELLVRWCIKLLGSALALDFDDLVSLRRPLFKAWERQALSSDLHAAARAAWLQRQVEALLDRDGASSQTRSRRQLALFDPWSITDRADLAVAQIVWQALADTPGVVLTAPLTVGDVWRISHSVLRDLTDPVLTAQGLWTQRELARLAHSTRQLRDRRKGRDGTPLVVVRPRRKLLHDHATWVQTVLAAS